MKASEIADVLERMGWEEIDVGGPHRYFNRPDGNLVWLPDEPDIGIDELDWFLDQNGVDKAEFDAHYRDFTSRKRDKPAPAVSVKGIIGAG